MSGTHSPTSDGSNGSRTRLTRTVAIIKNHALEHRMGIEERIQKAGFEIVKERQMEFDQNSDQEFLRELFGNDTPSLFQGPVWVYVLERRRAVEVWKTLMGEEDPGHARELSPNSLRSVYGVDSEHNAIMGSPDNETAEVQIQCLFQSSPPFSSQDPDEVDGITGIQNELGNDAGTDNGTVSDDWQTRENMLSPSSSQFSQTPNFSGSNGSQRPRLTSAVSNGSSKGSPDGKVPFRARPLPKTHESPDITPRITKAAALRAGIAVTSNRHDGPRIAPTKEEMKQVFMDVPGHKRSTTIQVASTAPPTIAPRMSRAAALRLGKAFPAAAAPRPKVQPSSNGGTFEGVPGHKRRETIQVASVQAPIVSPRSNKSAELRARKDTAPPTSFMFRGPTAPKAPGTLSRSSSQTPSRSASSLSRSSSSLGNRQSNTTVPSTPSGRLSSAGRPTIQKPLAGSSATAKEEEAAPTVRAAPARAPSIEPRTNRSALLRAKMGTPTPVKKVPVVNRRASMIV